MPDDPSDEGVRALNFCAAVSDLLDLLVIKHVSCSDLRDADWGGGKSDPFCVFLIGEEGQTWAEKLDKAVLNSGIAKTEVVENSLNPTFEFSAALSKPASLKKPEIHVKVFDKDLGSEALSWCGVNSDDSLGEVSRESSLLLLLPHANPPPPPPSPIHAYIRQARCSIPVMNKKGDVRVNLEGPGASASSSVSFSWEKTNQSLRKELSSVEEYNLKIVDKDAIADLSKVEGPKRDALEEAFCMSDCAKFAHLSAIVYAKPVHWASKKEGSSAYNTRPSKMSLPLRYLIGDLKRCKLVEEDNKFHVETLPDEFNKSHGTVEVNNGWLLDKKLDQQAMILLDKKDSAVILCFRGTDTGRLINSVKDQAVSFVGWHPFKVLDSTITSNGRVHLGMQKSWNRLKKVIVPIIEQLFSEGTTYKKIYVTGHSLGAALATVFTRGLYEQVPAIRGKIVGYTYGGYAIGNSSFQKDFDEKIPNFFRCVNDQDIIPHFIPPWLGYDHVGVLVHMSQNAMNFDMTPYCLKPGSWENDNRSALEMAADHAAISYSTLLDMYSVTDAMTKEQIEKTKVAWANFLSSNKAQVVPSVVQDSSCINYDRSLEPNFAGLEDAFKTEFTEPVSEEFGAISVEDFRMVLRGQTHKNGLRVGMGTVRWPHFVCTAYRVFYDPDKAARARRVQKARFLAIFNRYDTDFDEYLNEQEFRNLCRDAFPKLTEDMIAETTKRLDLDMDGFISQREFLIWGFFGAKLCG